MYGIFYILYFSGFLPRAWRTQKEAVSRSHRQECQQLCVCVFSSHLYWTSNSLKVPSEVTHDFSSKFLLRCVPFIFLARRIQRFFSLVDPEIDLRKNPSYRDSNSRPNVSEGYEVTSELPGEKKNNRKKKKKKKKHLTVVDPETSFIRNSKLIYCPTKACIA